jgi:hypothetical protein
MFRTLTLPLALAFSLLSTTSAYASGGCHASEITSISLPLDISGRDRLNAIEKRVHGTKKDAKRSGDDLTLINCHASLFNINVIQGLDYIKLAANAPKGKKNVLYVTAGVNLGKALKSARAVFNMYFAKKTQRYEFVWKNIKPEYERIAGAYAKEGYDLARIAYESVREAHEKITVLISKM